MKNGEVKMYIKKIKLGLMIEYFQKCCVKLILEKLQVFRVKYLNIKNIFRFFNKIEKICNGKFVYVN